MLHTSTLQPATWQPLTDMPVTTSYLGNGIEELAITLPSTLDRQFYKLQVTQPSP